MAADEPPYLTVGTDVSAKYKGAFCEAKVKKVNRMVKCKITFKNNHGSMMVQDDQIRGPLRIGALVEARHPEKNQFFEAIINKMQDYSQYTVVFDDGDETTLRRTSLCLKSGRHFAESPTLDQFPLTNPEHFGTPVINAVKSKRKRRSTYNSSTVDYSSSDEDLILKKPKATRRRERDPDIGKVFSVDFGDRRKKDSWYPGLVVLPSSSQDNFKINAKEEYLIRSFRDGKFYQVSKKETREFSRSSVQMRRVESPALKLAIDKALLYCEKGELPPNWDKALYGGMDAASGDEEESADTDTDSSDDEPSEEKDRFVAQLYKFMDERGTPINKAPTLGNKDINLYKLFKVVHKMGGHNRVTNQSKWKIVYSKMGLHCTNLSGPNQLKSSYKRFLHSFEDFYRKLGCTMVTNSRSTRGRHRSDRNFGITTRNTASPKTRTRSKDKSLEKKLEEKPISIEKKDGRSRFESPKSEEGGRKKAEKTKQEEKETKTKAKKEEEKPRLVRSQSLIKDKTAEEKKDQRNDRARTREESKKEKSESPEKKKETRSSVKLEQDREKKAAFPKKPKKEEKPPPPRESRSSEKKEAAEKKPERLWRERREEKAKIKTEIKKESDQDSKSEAELGKSEPRFFPREKKEKEPPKNVKEEKEPEDKEKAFKEERESRASSRRESAEPIGKMLRKINDSDSQQSLDKDDGTDIENASSENPSMSFPDDDEESRKGAPGERHEEQEDTKSLMGLSDADDEDDGSGSEKSEQEGKESLVEIGDRVKVKYGRGRTRKVYEAKVLKVDSSGGEKRVYVHYTGWNARFDEWVKRSFIVENISEKSKLSRQRRQDLFNKSNLPLGKRSERSPKPPGLTSTAKLTRKNSTSSTNSVSSSRTTRSDKNKFHSSPFSKGLQPKKRTRRKSGVAAMSDSSESDEDGMVFLYRGGDINDEETQMEPDKSEDTKKESPSDEDDEDTKKSSQNFASKQDDEDSCTTTTEKSVSSESESKSETIKLESTSEAEMSSSKDQKDDGPSLKEKSLAHSDEKNNEKRPSCIYSPKKSYLEPTKKPTESSFLPSNTEKDSKPVNVVERKPFTPRTDMPNVLLYKTPDNVVIDMTRRITPAERIERSVLESKHIPEEPKVTISSTSIPQKSVVEEVKKEADRKTVLVESAKPTFDAPTPPPITYVSFNDTRTESKPITEPLMSTTLSGRMLSITPSLKLKKQTLAVKPEPRKVSVLDVENLVEKKTIQPLPTCPSSTAAVVSSPAVSFSSTQITSQVQVQKEEPQKVLGTAASAVSISKPIKSKPTLPQKEENVATILTKPTKMETVSTPENTKTKTEIPIVPVIPITDTKSVQIKKDIVAETPAPVVFKASSTLPQAVVEKPTSKPDPSKVISKAKVQEETPKPSVPVKTVKEEPAPSLSSPPRQEEKKNTASESKETSLQTSVITFVASSNVTSSTSTIIDRPPASSITKPETIPEPSKSNLQTPDLQPQLEVKDEKPNLTKVSTSDSLVQDSKSEPEAKISSSPDNSTQGSLTELSIDEEGSHDEKKDTESSPSSNDNSISPSEEKAAVEALLKESLKSDDTLPTDVTESPEKREEEDTCDAEKTIEDSSSSNNVSVFKKEFKKKKSKMAKKLGAMSGSTDKEEAGKSKSGKLRKKKTSENEDSKDSESKIKSKKLKRNKKQKRLARQEELEAGGDTEKETSILSSAEKPKKKEKRKEKKFTKFQDSKLDAPSTSKGEISKKERKKGRKSKLSLDRKTELGEKKVKKRKKTLVDDNDSDSDKETTPLRFTESKKVKEKKKKVKSKETSSSDDAASSYGKLLIDEMKGYSESQERSDDPDMSFLLCEEKVPASPVNALPDDTTASSSLDDSNNASPSSEEERLQDQVNLLYQRAQAPLPPESLALLNKRTAEARVLANTPPTTPSSSDSIASSSPSHEPFPEYAESTHSGRESGDGNESDSNACIANRVSESEEYTAAATLAFDVCKSQEKPKQSPLKRQKSETTHDDEFSPMKRKRKSKKSLESPHKVGHPRVRGLSRYSKGDTHDTLDSSGTSSNPMASPSHSSSLYASFSHASNQPMSIASDGTSSTRGGKSFFVPLHEYKDPEKRIAVLLDKMSDMKKEYAKLKAEVASIDHRRKKARKKMREAAAGAAAAAAANNTSSPLDEAQNFS